MRSLILFLPTALGFAIASVEAETSAEVDALTERVTQLEQEVADLKEQLKSLQASTNQDTEESWVKKLVGLRNHMHTAFSVGPELTLLDPDKGLRIVQKAWPQIQVREVKTGILKAFAFGKALRPKKHPHVLQILNLGMTDSDAEIRRYAATYVQEFAKQDFAQDPEGYAAWYRKFGTKSPEEVIRLSTAEVPTSLKQQLAKLTAAFRAGEMNTVQNLAAKIGETEHPYAIPTLIGVIDADNSYDTVYGVGYFGLRHATGVSYSPFHDGAWWRRWWAKNKQNYPPEIAELSIPDLPKTEHGKQHKPFPDNTGSLEGKLEFLRQALAAGDGRVNLWDLAGEIAKHEDPSAIPILIGIIEADNTYDTIYGVGYFGLGKLTGVTYEESHDGKWWRQWWNDNKSKYPDEVQSIPVPDFKDGVAAWRTAFKKREQEEALADVADIPAEDLLVGSNEKMRYFRIGPLDGATAPQEGYKLIVIMPGGDGSAEFHPFVRRLYKHSLDESYLAVQPVAFKWRPGQQIVWPTRTHKVPGQKFSTEDFVEKIIADVATKYPLNRKAIYTLSWSSSGPAAYALSLAKDTPVTGSYIAMSVFKPDTLPPLDRARGKAYFLDHSPDDQVCPFWMAQEAKQALDKNGATVQLNTYGGGHGWHGNIYARVTGGVKWLEQQAVKR